MMGLPAMNLKMMCRVWLKTAKLFFPLIFQALQDPFRETLHQRSDGGSVDETELADELEVWSRVIEGARQKSRNCTVFSR